MYLGVEGLYAFSRDHFNTINLGLKVSALKNKMIFFRIQVYILCNRGTKSTYSTLSVRNVASFINTLFTLTRKFFGDISIFYSYIKFQYITYSKRVSDI